MYSTIKVRNSIQATPQGRRLQRAGVGFELAIKLLLVAIAILHFTAESLLIYYLLLPNY